MPSLPDDARRMSTRKLPLSRVLYIEQDDFMEDPPTNAPSRAKAWSRPRHREIDEAPEQIFAPRAEPPSCELLYGLAGMGVCFFERDQRASARAGLERVVERLEATLVEKPQGIAWAQPGGHRQSTERRPGTGAVLQSRAVARRTGGAAFLAAGRAS